MLTYHLSKSLYKPIINSNIYKKSKNIGNIKLYIDNQYCIINSLYFKKKYRNLEFGSFVLKDTELYLKNNYQINQIGLLAWQKQGNNEVFYFFEKNGYKIEDSNCKIDTYDDYNTIYDLKKYIKYI